MHTITAQQIFESIPSRFRAEKAAGFNTVFHFEIMGTENFNYTVTIQDGTCKLTEGLHGTPHCIIKTLATIYIDMETGKQNAQMALMLGKVKVSNIVAMLQFAKCFKKFNELAETLTTNTTNTIRQAKQGPLAGVKIVDFTRLLPGPLATMFLADMGADVIKVEDPDRPDYIRDFEPKVNGESLFYLSLNRCKRSLAINYLSPAGKQVIYDLIKTADVFIEQFRPGVMAELGFGYYELAAINPKLIYVSVTGYGQQSVKAMHAGHDLNYIAIAGSLGITGSPDGKLTIPGFQLADIAGGSYMAMNAITTALYQREKTGKGDWIDLAMTDAALPLSVLQFAHHQGTKQNISPGTFELSGGLANYNVYACKDSKYIALGSLEPKFWNKFCAKAGRLDWQQQFLKQGEELQTLKQEVANYFMQKTQAEWLSYFELDDICLTAVNQLQDIENDAHLLERGMFIENENVAIGKYKTINQPLKFLQAPFSNNWSAPDLGADNAAIFEELNYSPKQVADLQHINSNKA